MIGIELNLSQYHKMRRAKVLKKSLDLEGEEFGVHDSNPLLSTLAHDVQIPDREIKQVGANIIAQNMYSQVNADGTTHTMLDGIIDYSTDRTEVKKYDETTATPSGEKRARESTDGLSLKVK